MVARKDGAKVLKWVVEMDNMRVVSMDDLKVASMVSKLVAMLVIGWVV